MWLTVIVDIMLLFNVCCWLRPLVITRHPAAKEKALSIMHPITEIIVLWCLIIDAPAGEIMHKLGICVKVVDYADV